MKTVRYENRLIDAEVLYEGCDFKKLKGTCSTAYARAILLH